MSGKKLSFDICYHELPRETDTVGCHADLTVGTVPMKHHWSSVGYVFHFPDHRLGITGDTRWCRGIKRLAEQSGLLVLECTTLRRQAGSHVSLEELRAKRQSLPVARIILVHVSEGVADELSRNPIEGVEVADDGLLLEVPAEL